MEGKDVQKGLRVTYIPRNARTDYSKRELGVISSWNDSFVFVDYGTGTNKATKYEDLVVGMKRFFLIWHLVAAKRNVVIVKHRDLN